MDDFFKTPPRHPEPFDEPAMPEWMGPPSNVLPGDVPLSIVVARTADAIIWMHAVTVYPTGVSFTLMIRSRVPDELDPFDPMNGPFGFFGRHPDQGDRVFRFGVEFSDGRRATTLDAFPLGEAHDPLARPDHPVLIQGGGGGGEGTWNIEHWLWPLPPPGPITFACAWPAKDIPFTKSTVNGDLFVAAAERAETLWPDPGLQSRSGVRRGFITYGGSVRDVGGTGDTAES